jgi:hypothetical protein
VLFSKNPALGSMSNRKSHKYNAQAAADPILDGKLPHYFALFSHYFLHYFALFLHFAALNLASS